MVLTSWFCLLETTKGARLFQLSAGVSVCCRCNGGWKGSYAQIPCQINDRWIRTPSFPTKRMRTLSLLLPNLWLDSMILYIKSASILIIETNSRDPREISDHGEVAKSILTQQMMQYLLRWVNPKSKVWNRGRRTQERDWTLLTVGIVWELTKIKITMHKWWWGGPV